MPRWVLAILALATSAAAHAAPLTYAQADAVNASPAVVAALDTLTDAAGAGTLATTLRALAASDALTTAEREAALYSGVLGLVERPRNEPLVTLLEELSSRPPQVHVVHHDAGHRARIPVFDVAAAARYVLHRWAVDDVAADLAARLRRQQTLTPDAARRVPDDVQRAASAKAMSAASKAQLYAQREALMRALARDPRLGDAALVVARRLRDGVLLAAVARDGDARSARRALKSAASWVDPAAARAVIEAGIARDETASIAIFALAEQARTYPAARAALLERLSDPQLGGSAAAALARLADPALVTTLAARLRREADATTAARIALALKLMNTEPAREALREFAAAPGSHATLKAKLGRGASR